MTAPDGWPAVAAVLTGAGLLAVARARRWLTRNALPAAGAVGLAVVLGTGAGGGLILLVFLASTSVLTRFRGGRKTAQGGEHAAGSGGRSARQVWANGGVAAACALLSLTQGLRPLAAGAAGALCAALADSWATELGTAVRGRTVLVTTLADVPPGTSGGVSIVGTVAGLAGSMVAGTLVALGPTLWAVPWAGVGAPWSGSVAAGAAVALAGVMGMFVDSFLGATLESRRPWIDNEAVNVLSTLTGAAAAILLT